MATSIHSQLSKIGNLLFASSGHIQCLESLNGARNPEASLRTAHELCLDLHFALQTAGQLRDRFKRQAARTKGGR